MIIGSFYLKLQTAKDENLSDFEKEDNHLHLINYPINFTFCTFYRFFALNLGIVYLYYNSFQKIDDEEYGGASEILKEGLMTSFAAFLVPFVFYLKNLHVFEKECMYQMIT